MKSGLGIEAGFPRTYEIEILGSAPALQPHEELHQFPANLSAEDRFGIYVRVASHSGLAWVGFFLYGFESEQALSGLYSCPDPGSLCVVARGYGYIVETGNPGKCSAIDQKPVVQVVQVPELQLLIFLGSRSISGWGRSGLEWPTKLLSWEGVSISGLDVRNKVLHGKGWDARSDLEVPFEVNLETGQHTGGARPELA